MSDTPATSFLAIDAALDTLGATAIRQPGQPLAQAAMQAAIRQEDGLPPLPKPRRAAAKNPDEPGWIAANNLFL